MSTSVLTSIEEYLNTSYHPDREFIDGEILERNVGSWEHGHIQSMLSWWFIQNGNEWGIQVASEWRTRVAEDRVRIPDFVVVRRGSQTRVLAIAPVLIVEILSPEDSSADTERRAQDYQRMGVQTIWIIDPETRTARVCSGKSWTQATRLEVPGTPIYMELDTVFAQLG
jgi:Uma2 family endonuclease